MADNINPSLTPNVVVANPIVRKYANIVLGIALVVFPTAAVLDASSVAIDFADWLIPATAVTSFLAGLFGLAVTTPNVPTKVIPEPEASIAEDAAVDPADVPEAEENPNVG